MAPAPPCRILITGASSGIGAALAETYAAAGVTLHLGGRDGSRLEAVAMRCRGRGAVTEARVQDVTDAPGMARWIADAFSAGPLDLVIANAGISGEGAIGPGAEPGEPGQAGTILATNLIGVINTVYPALERMLDPTAPPPAAQPQIAIMSSLAGFRGMPTAPAYCSSKAALVTFADTLRCAVARRGIAVSVICPGFIETPMTAANDFPMPFLMTGERAARIIRRGLERRRTRITFPRRLAAALWLFNAMPRALSDRVLGRFHGKPG